MAASIVLGLVLFSALASIPGVTNLDWRIDATVDRCDAGAQEAIDGWVAARRQAGWDVSVRRDETPSSVAGLDGSTRAYQVTHAGLTGLGYLRLFAATDLDLQFPPAFRRNCMPRSFNWWLPVSARAATLPVLLLASWYAAIVVLVGWSLRRRTAERDPGYRYGWRAYSSWLAFGLMTTFVVMLIAHGLHDLFGIDLQSGQRESVLAMIRADPWLLFLFVLAGPFCEESLFRGWLLRDFVAAGMARSGSVVVSLSFAGMHMIGDPDNASTSAYAVLVFLISIVLCWVYLRYRSLLASTLTHMAHNAASMSIALAAGWLTTAPSP
ncbi:MAG TPA: type II CAAX endopeptidase family protein [Rudaea sp.]